MKKKHRCSLQFHKKNRDNYSSKRQLHIQIKSKNIILKPYQSITIKPYTKHRMHAKNTNCIYMESLLPNLKM